MRNITSHTFHIPVMGLGYTIDSPIKVGKYGITSVVSIIEDHLVEQMREVICTQENLPYEKITNKDEDRRAKRVTAYLNVLNEILNRQIEKIKQEDFETDSDINLYFEYLPETSVAKKLYLEMLDCRGEKRQLLQKALRHHILAGSIDVNIMTKLDKTNYDDDGNPLPVEYCDAMAALRGFAKSDVNGSIVFSAGLNPRLFGYCETFSDFFPNRDGKIKKTIILKVSDYRSALIQGKYLAKKGLWVSEFRIESGINCGGHLFVSNGTPMGPVMEEFKNKRHELYQELFAECTNALKSQDRYPFAQMPKMKISVQGGIGTAEENSFLLNYYNVDSIGWGSPFLLVPEATNVDDETLQKLIHAKKEDYYISHASPLGIPFSNFHHSSSEQQRKERINKNKPGSPCYKKFLSSDVEFTERPICTASREYQNNKIKQLKESITDATRLAHEIDKVVEKDCLCEGLGSAALLKNHSKLSHNLTAVTICPGPNLAYFKSTYSLKEMIDHIYGRSPLHLKSNRPNVFVNELQLYADYLKNEIEEDRFAIKPKKTGHFEAFKNNLLEGINYYEKTFTEEVISLYNFRDNILEDLKRLRTELNAIDTKPVVVGEMVIAH
ncbi:MAG TPA: hypothetical protein PLH61_02540 [Bacteroidia bacterium]|nr:hypothetical protein [Bacteroidia bacterium]